jgi:hypothetical protein
MIQALDSWLQHSADRESLLDSHNPATGISLAYNNYGTRFFELYTADLDGANNGSLDAAGKPLINDLRYWNSRLTAADLAGDYNFNGEVDAADYVNWRTMVGSASPLPNDDTAGVDTGDYVRWRSSFGQAASASAASMSSAPVLVPEPTTFGICVLIAALVPIVSRPAARRARVRSKRCRRSS